MIDGFGFDFNSLIGKSSHSPLPEPPPAPVQAPVQIEEPLVEEEQKATTALTETPAVTVEPVPPKEFFMTEEIISRPESDAVLMNPIVIAGVGAALVLPLIAKFLL